MTNRCSFRIVGFLAALFASIASHSASAQQAAADLGRAYNGTGLALFENLAGADGNIVISPYGIGSAMAMAATGSRGKTADEMTEVLKYPVPAAELGAAAEVLGLKLTMRDGGEDAEITIANALHVTANDDVVSGDYKALVKEKFGAEVFSGSDLEVINSWVEEKTDGKIRELLKQVDPSSVCVLLNAVHFKGGWTVPFDARKTGQQPFHLASGDDVDVPMMNVSGAFAIVHSETVDAVSLPFKGEKLAMAIIVPKQPAVPSADTITDTLADLGKAEPQTVSLSMPKFSFEYAADLADPFMALGLKRPFNDAQADFTGIVSQEGHDRGLFISQVRHKAFIDVNEAGVEAAAATAVEFAIRSLSLGPEPFRIDRPFVFAITDKISGAVLFVGRVTDPRT